MATAIVFDVAGCAGVSTVEHDRRILTAGKRVKGLSGKVKDQVCNDVAGLPSSRLAELYDVCTKKFQVRDGPVFGSVFNQHILFMIDLWVLV